MNDQIMRLSEIASVPMLGARNLAMSIRRKLEVLLASGTDRAVIDFHGVAATESFLDELVGVLVVTHGEKVLSRLVFTGCDPDTKSFLSAVVRQRLSHRNDLRTRAAAQNRRISSAVSSTYFGLLAEFGTAEIPLSTICEKFFGLAPEVAKKRAALHRLPVPVYRAGSQKSGWLVSAIDLAQFIDDQKSRARKEWEKARSGLES